VCDAGNLARRRLDVHKRWKRGGYHCFRT
jgi:hypothetical protein